MIILTIIALSFACGWLFDTLYTVFLEKTHPCGYADEVTRYAEEFGISSEVSAVYASIKVRSDFDAGLVTDGEKIGLFQLTSGQYYTLGEKLGSYTDAGLLYEPDTNLKFGVFWMSLLFKKYDRDITAVFAAMYAGEATVDGWLADPALTDQKGRLVSVPDKETEKYVKEVTKAFDIYRELYE